MRKELSGGLDLRQRGHHALLALNSPQTRKLVLRVDLEGDQSSFIESLNRESLLSRFLAGGLWRPVGQATIKAQAGWTASQHRAGTNRSDDNGLARRLGAQWGSSRLPLTGLRANMQFVHEGDSRPKLASNDTRLSCQTAWTRPSDTVFVEWEQEWSSSRFYPSRDRFDQVGRQDRLYRLAHAYWTHAETKGNNAGVRRIVDAINWRADAVLSLNQNTYQMSEAGGNLLVLPGDARTARRSYSLGATTSFGPFSLIIDYRYRWVDDRFREVRRNQRAETGEVDVALTHRLGDSDSAGIHAISRVTSYTIPVTGAFYDDRDQAERVLKFFLYHRFSPELTARPEFSFQRQHQVILAAERSADNNTNDVYVLEPHLQWRPVPSVLLQQTFSIRAHYRYLDFAPPGDQSQGTLYRRAESVTDSRITQSRRTVWTIRYVYRYEDFGGLYDREGWVQAVDWDRRGHLVDGRWSWRPIKGFSVEPGIGLEYKRSYTHRREGTTVRRVADPPFWRRQILVNAQWQSLTGYNVRLTIGRRIQDTGLGTRDRDDRWELSMSKDL